MRSIPSFIRSCLACIAIAASFGASAQVATYTLDTTNVGAFGTAPYGTVTLTQSFNDVLVNVSLRSDMNFVDTGAHSIFTFNLANATTADIQNITFVNGLGDVFAIAPNAANAPFSTFAYGIRCQNVTNNKCVNGGSGGGYVDPLNFKVLNALISDFAFKSTGSGIAAYFAADVISRGATGTVGATAPVVSAVPEPETYALMLAGLGLIGTIARRRKANQA